MVEYTKVKSPADIIGRGYKDLGIYTEGDKTKNKIINTANKGKIDIMILEFGVEGISQLFIKSASKGWG